jgi:hypothetical protein
MLYITGFYDALTSVADANNDTTVATHYQSCLQRSKMTNSQLANNIRAYAQSRPELQTGGVAGALINYLLSACGPIPK